MQPRSLHLAPLSEEVVPPPCSAAVSRLPGPPNLLLTQAGPLQSRLWGYLVHSCHFHQEPEVLGQLFVSGLTFCPQPPSTSTQPLRQCQGGMRDAYDSIHW